MVTIEAFLHTQLQFRACTVENSLYSCPRTVTELEQQLMFA